MSTARAEEIIKKGFLKSLQDGTLELKDLAGINIDLPIARQAYLQGVQEATQVLIDLIKTTMATAAKQDLQATSAGQALQATASKQDILKGVMDSVKAAVESVDTKADLLGTAAKQDILKGVMDSVLAGIALIYEDMATGAIQELQATGAKQDLLKSVMDEARDMLVTIRDNIESGPFDINTMEVTTDWDKGNFDSMELDAVDYVEGSNCVKFNKASAGDAEWNSANYDPDALIDLSKTKILKIAIKSSHGRADLSRAYVILKDSTNRQAYWELDGILTDELIADTWMVFSLPMGVYTNQSTVDEEGIALDEIEVLGVPTKTTGDFGGAQLTVRIDWIRGYEGTDKLFKAKLDAVFAGMATATGQAAILDAINEEAYVEVSDDNLYSETRSDVVISTTYIATILKVRILIAGTYRVEWEMKQYADQVRGYFKVYKNGVAHGSEQSGASPYDEWSQVSEDLYFIAGDVLCIYGKEIDAHQIMCKNLQLDGTISEGVAYQE